MATNAHTLDANDVTEPEADEDEFSPEFLAEVAAARDRGQRALREKPHAEVVEYDRRTRRLYVELTSGSGFFVPVDQLPGLVGATEDDVARMDLAPLGVAIEWPTLDYGVTVAALAQHVFSRQTLARAFAAAGGRAKSDAKTEAARRNGAKGGRPRKTAPRETEMSARDAKADAYLEQAKRELREKIEAAKQQYRTVTAEEIAPFLGVATVFVPEPPRVRKVAEETPARRTPGSRNTKR